MERAQDPMKPTLRLNLTGEILANHGLDTSNENRRLRTILEVLLKREDTTAMLVDLAWTDRGFNFTFCCPNGNDAEVRLTEAVFEMLDGGIDQTLGLLIQAARDVMDPATMARWVERAQQLATARRTNGEEEGRT